MNPVHFQDLRHVRRLRNVLTALGEHPTASVPQATQSASESQSIDRFWANPKVSIGAILASHLRQGLMCTQ
ncbi:MAG: transposase DNA-binding-containing protein [Spirulina sp.]